MLLSVFLVTACAAEVPSTAPPPTMTQTAAASAAQVVEENTQTPTRAPTGTRAILPTQARVDSTSTGTLTRVDPTLTSLPTRVDSTSTGTPTRVDPTITPLPETLRTITKAPVSDTNIYFEAVTFTAYPYESFLRDAVDPNNNVPYRALDRAAYEASHPETNLAPKTFRAVILENQFLKLTFLPELGGRLFQITYKPTNQTLLYNNRYLKPTPWGMPAQGGWLAAGGIEWAFPTQEHGYEWNAAWNFETQLSDSSAVITLRDSDAADRPRVQIRVTLPAHAAYFKIEPRVENPTNTALRLQFWDNAMLNLGAKQISAETEFILPGDSVLIHSTGNDWLPQERIPEEGATAPRAPISFSDAAGRDLRWYKNWDDYLGVFAAAQFATNFVGAYNHATELGIVRVFPPQAHGVKLFAWGSHFCCFDLFADDGSQYFELWGGIAQTFFASDDVTFAPHEARAWTEYWMPLAKTNGVSAAASDAALSLQVENNQANIIVYSAIAREAYLVVKQNGVVKYTERLVLTPAQAYTKNIPIESAPAQIELQDVNRKVILKTN